MRTTRANVVALVAALLALLLVAPAAPAGAAGSPSLRDRVVAALQGSTAGAVGAAVAADGMGPIVDIAGQAMLPPGSTQKLYTGGAALQLLGPQYRYHTTVRAAAWPSVDGTVAGDLTLIAPGDPTLVGDDLQRLAFDLAGAGVRHVTGALRVDDGRYDRARGGAGWKPGWVGTESPPLSAFVVDRNSWRRDPAFLADPVLPNVGRFRVALERAGIAVDGPDAVGLMPGWPGVELAGHDSAPLAAIVGPMLKTSDNFASELLLKELGVTLGAGTANSGAEAIWRLADSFGIGRGQTADGSGLSVDDRERPWHEVGWLVAMAATPVADNLRYSLPLACGDGTLQQRMCATPAAGRVFAKTGTLNGATALAGYATTRTGRRVFFAFQLAAVRDLAAARNAVDRAVVQLVTMDG